jgi:hypothetical protein
MSDENYHHQMNTFAARVHKALHEATGDANRIGEILRSLDDVEILVQHVASLPDDVRQLLEAELGRRSRGRK